MEKTLMGLWKVVLYDGEQAYVENFIAKPTDKELIIEYLALYDETILIIELDKCMLTINELRKALSNEWIRDKYINMYMIKGE